VARLIYIRSREVDLWLSEEAASSRLGDSTRMLGRNGQMTRTVLWQCGRRVFLPRILVVAKMREGCEWRSSALDMRRIVVNGRIY
jgi:hypothetical protein